MKIHVDLRKGGRELRKQTEEKNQAPLEGFQSDLINDLM
jgi:hypothetical protein